MRDDVKFELPPHRLLNGLRPAAPLVARPFSSGYRRCEIHNASFSKVIQIWPKELMRIFYKLLSVFHPSEMTEFVYTQDTYQTDLQKLEPYLTRKSLIVMILVVCVRKIVASVLSSSFKKLGWTNEDQNNPPSRRQEKRPPTNAI
ncbi:uncharacterized protein [Triticum aestivum]|uniref:uncharacterized protein isoform X2 n=1 Tax=Triticum aestivum TaxID=4565 RepID=UPI001D011259|nr:uncharacterized protein LOC123095062 isoform X2 [Triticum aestivum]